MRTMDRRLYCSTRCRWHCYGAPSSLQKLWGSFYCSTLHRILRHMRILIQINRTITVRNQPLYCYVVFRILITKELVLNENFLICQCKTNITEVFMYSQLCLVDEILSCGIPSHCWCDGAPYYYHTLILQWVGWGATSATVVGLLPSKGCLVTWDHATVPVLSANHRRREE